MASGSRTMANGRRQDDGPESVLSDAIIPHGKGQAFRPVASRRWLPRMPTDADKDSDQVRSTETSP